MQFESLEKQCQDLSSSSPSVFSSFSFDSLETGKNISPDSLETIDDKNIDYHKTLKIDVPIKKKTFNKYSLNQTGSSESNDSTDSAINFDTSSDNFKSLCNLKIWKSLECLNLSSNGKSLKEKSSENLSEDSGYSDNFNHYLKNKCNSIPEIVINQVEMGVQNESFHIKHKKEIRNNSSEFVAYDGEVFQNFKSNFGFSYQDLTNFQKYSPPLHLKKNDKENQMLNCNFVSQSRASEVVYLEKQSLHVPLSNYNSVSSSEPNLVYSEKAVVDSVRSISVEHLDDKIEQFHYKQSYFKDDLDSTKEFNRNNEVNCGKTFCEINYPTSNSVALGNWDIADLLFDTSDGEDQNKMIMSKKFRKARVQPVDRKSVNAKNKEVGLVGVSSTTEARFRREGSYLEAMSNRVDLSDDEGKKFKEFDKDELKAISEVDLQNFIENAEEIDLLIYLSTPIAVSKRNVISTPDLAILKTEPLLIEVVPKRSSMYEMQRKIPFVNKSTSTSGTSDMEEKTLKYSKSFSGSVSSSKVHFSPVVSEVNWKDESDTSDKDSSNFSSSSSPDRDVRKGEHRRIPLIKPKPRKFSVSQPELIKVGQQECIHAKDCEGVDCVFVPLEEKPIASSQPEVNVMQRRGSRIERRDSTDKLFNAYSDADGVSYQHNQLADTKQSSPPFQSNHVPVNNNIPPLNINREKRAVAMERSASCRDRKTGKLGGFFSRLVSFRFSTRKSADNKNKQPKKKNDNKEFVPYNQQRIATKEDYIYIPLKGPLPDNKSNVETLTSSDRLTCVSGKPPLPKMPPRVVGASVKRRLDMTAQTATPEYRIDSGSVLNRPMEPMGLLETDLDTEVTVITSGANVKTRSLMNLGAEVPVRNLEAPCNPSRPHKSMEYLLDKQNLKVVEVSN